MYALKVFRNQIGEFLLLLIFFIFSSILMWKTFRIDPSGNMQIASKAWSDFSATIPLIRSFSFGDNFPPEYPLFSGPAIKYHFVFFAIVGFLEKIGLPLDLALNLPSSISFFLLLSAIYFFGKMVFKSKRVAILSVVLFLFNGSLGFLEFFKKNPLSYKIIWEILKNKEFTSFGPWDGKVVSAFWSLNIFTNQRHLAFAYASFLFLILAIFRFSQNPRRFSSKYILLMGILTGLFPFIHLAVFGMMLVTLILSSLVFPRIRRMLIISIVISILLATPQLLYMGFESKGGFFKPGYLIEELNFFNFVKYWFYNLGLTSILSLLGFILLDKNRRKIFIPFLAFFVMGNLFQFTPATIDNHKFFNLTVIGLNFLTSFFLVNLWNKKVWLRALFFPSLLILTLTGIIDFFPIINDRLVTLEDATNNKTVSFILYNTSPDSSFLNASYIFDPASLAGRKIYLGWHYFPWSLGYDTTFRQRLIEEVLNSNDKATICNFSKSEKIDYLEVKKPASLHHVFYNYDFFNSNFFEVFRNGDNFFIYDLKKSCNY